MRIGVKGAPVFKGSAGVFGKAGLRSLKLKAVRRRVWFVALTRVDRALFNLTLKVADRVRSHALAKALNSIVVKLEEALQPRILQVLKSVGFPLCRKLSLLAKKWGNRLAENWMRDLSFAKFLAIMHLNNPGGPSG